MAYWTYIFTRGRRIQQGVASRCGNSPGRTMPENEQSRVHVKLL